MNVPGGWDDDYDLAAVCARFGEVRRELEGELKELMNGKGGGKEIESRQRALELLEATEGDWRARARGSLTPRGGDRARARR
jgi:hypothetical protein